MTAEKLPMIISAAVLGLAGFLGYNFIYLPRQEQVAQLQMRIAEERSMQQEQADVAKLMAEFDQLRARLPKEPDPSWLAQEVAALSQQAGIQLANLSQELPQAREDVLHLAVALEFSSPYHQLGTFIDLIEQSEYFLQVEHLDMSPSLVAYTGRVDPVVRMVVGTWYVPPVRGLPGPTARAAQP
ncbi:MAG TPA: type 4a pilus biogenesis protein PilO [Gemmatimonadaceae bacterium]